MTAISSPCLEGDVKVERCADRVLVNISGHFGFSLHKKFRDAWLGSPRGQKFVLDMTRVDHIDSAALGMLLVLREQAGGDQSDIEIRNCGPGIYKLLQVADFQSLFKFS